MKQAILNRARSDKFILVLDIPTVLKTYFSDILQENYSADVIQLTCFGSPVPSLKVPSIAIPYGGQTHQISSNVRPAFDPFTIDFLVDNGWKNYWILSQWLNMFNDAKTGFTNVNYSVRDSNIAQDIKNPFGDFSTTFKTFALDEYNKKIMSFTYRHAFVTNVSEVNFSHQDPSEIKCKASFVYNQFQPTLIRNVDDTNC